MNVSSKIRDLISPLVDDMNEDQYAQPYGARLNLWGAM